MRQKEKKASMQKRVRLRVFFYTNKSMFVFFYKDALLNINELDSTLPSVFSSLLQEFEDVFPNDGPSGLPPFRGIEHQIGFNSKTIISN